MYGECTNVGFFILSTAVFITGFTGNIVSILVWAFGGICRNLYGAKFFLFISILDLYVIVIHPGLNFVDNVWNLEISVYNRLVCKYLNFSQYYFIEMSVFLAVAIAADCVLTSYFPLQYTTKRSVERAYAVTIFLIVFLYLLNIQNVFNADVYSPARHVTGHAKTALCTQEHGLIITDENTISYLIFVINFLLMSFVPTLLLTICGTIVCFKLLDKDFVHHCLRNQNYSQCKYVLSISVLYLIASIPWLVHTVTQFMGEVSDMYCMAYVTLCLSAALKPWLYMALGREFRSDINDAMYRCCFRALG